MSTMTRTAAALALAVSMLGSLAVAAPTVTIVLDTDPSNGYADVLEARKVFRNGLGSAIAEEDFSGYRSIEDDVLIPYTTLPKLFGSDKAHLDMLPLGDGTPTAGFIEDDKSAGRFDPQCGPDSGTTSPTCQWFDSNGQNFAIELGEAFNAFGFFGTDFGDFGATLTLSARRNVDSQWVMIDLNGNADGFDLPAPSSNGSIYFVGFLDQDSKYSAIRFQINQSGQCDDEAPESCLDVFGFDDLVVGNVERNNVPEPGSLALVGGSLLLLCAARRRRRA